MFSYVTSFFYAIKFFILLIIKDDSKYWWEWREMGDRGKGDWITSYNVMKCGGLKNFSKYYPEAPEYDEEHQKCVEFYEELEKSFDEELELMKKENPDKIIEKIDIGDLR